MLEAGSLTVFSAESKEHLCTVEAALSHARVVDQSLSAWSHLVSLDKHHPAPTGLLQDWAFGVKDNIDVADMPTRCGSPVTDSACKVFDASVVAQLRAAGAVPIGKTVTTEFAFVTPGPTCNPWNPLHTPGGSSSGSAAAVAAGMVPIALGTQTGGSMIRPAAYCGVVGFKPSAGLVSREGMHLLCESLDVIGWYGTSVSHAKAVGDVLLPARHKATRSLEDLTVVWLDANPGHCLETDAAAALSVAATQLRGHVAHLELRTELRGHAELLRAHAALMHYEFARSMRAIVSTGDSRLSPSLVAAVRQGQAVNGCDYIAARTLQSSASKSWEAHFGNADLVLTSSALGAAPPGLHHTGNSAFNKGWSVLGWPCVHLPTSQSADGLPLGVMLVARPYDDLDLLNWAQHAHQIMDQRSSSTPPSYQLLKVQS